MFLNKMALFVNKMLIGINGLLESGDINDIHSDLFWTEGAGVGLEFMRSFLVGMDNMLLPFGFFLCAVLGVYAIVLGVNFARAEDPKAAKKRIVATITSLIVIIIVVMILKFIFIPNMNHIFAFINETFKIA